MPLAQYKLQELADWLSASDIDVLELTGPSLHIRLTRDGRVTSIEPAVHAEARTAATLVKSLSVGVLLHQHPLRQGVMAVRGDRVEVGQALGLLQIGCLLLPVLAPRAGTVHSVLEKHGATVGFGAPLFELLD